MNTIKYRKDTNVPEALSVNEGRETCPSSCYEVIIALKLRSDKDTTRKEVYGPVSLVNSDVALFNKTW